MLGGKNCSSMADSKLKTEKIKGQNITVLVRCRPRNDMEINMNSPNVIEVHSDRREIVLTGDHAISGHWSQNRTFVFDRVFDHRAKQIDLYKSEICPILEEVIQGYSCTIFAYGQTGTGKTYTMEGCRSSDKFHYSWDQDPQSGIIPRSMHQLFEMLDRSQNFSEYSVRVSFLEIYNEELYDLLGPPFESQKLRIYEDTARRGSAFVHGLEELIVHNKNEVYSILERGAQRRQTATTLLNAQSSRSHTVFSVTVNMKENNIQGEDILKTGKLYLVDLAGSENIGRSGAIERRAREAGTINQSLLTLGRVIFALVEKTKHIPYRESKLTRLLQDSLGGRTKTVIIATISPSAYNIEETLSTLEYAQRAKHIKNRPEVNQLNKKGLIKEYTEAIEKLKKDLGAARDKNGIFLSEDTYGQMQNTLITQKDMIIELEDQINALREQFEKINNMFEENQQTLESHRDELGHAKRWLKWVRDELLTAKNRIRIKTNQIHEKDSVNFELVRQQQKLHQEADEISKIASEELDYIRVLNRKVVTLRDIGTDNEKHVKKYTKYLGKSTSGFLNQIEQLKIANDRQSAIYHEEHRNVISCLNIQVADFASYLNNKFVQVFDDFQKLRTNVDLFLNNTQKTEKDATTQFSTAFDHLISSMTNMLADFQSIINKSSEHASSIDSISYEFVSKMKNTAENHLKMLDSNITKFNLSLTSIKSFVKNDQFVAETQETVKNQSRILLNSVDTWKKNIYTAVSGAIDNYFKTISTDTQKNVTATTSAFDLLSDKITTQNAQIDSHLITIHDGFTDFKASMETSTRDQYTNITLFYEEIDKRFKIYQNQLEKAKIQLDQTSTIINSQAQNCESSYSENISKMVQNITEYLTQHHSQIENIYQYLEHTVNHIGEVYGRDSEKCKEIVDKLIAYFNNYCELNEKNRLKTIQLLNNIMTLYTDRVSSRKFSAKSIGDTPSIENIKINPITIPRSLEEIASSARLADSINSPTPLKHRVAINKLKSLENDTPIPMFSFDAVELPKPTIEKENQPEK
ncbi:hypothetical protein HZS_7018 [Henneguya salminicola]|nr:hypothetical protein HZS_7018 [Henneguya salminicola]